jgi:hypothetical protein
VPDLRYLFPPVNQRGCDFSTAIGRIWLVVMSLRELLPTVEFIQHLLRHDLARETTRQAD